jgi:hypothetical protein
MAYNWTTEWPGVYAHHQTGCPLRNGGDCTCGDQLTYRATLKTGDDRERVVSPDFATAIEARDWLRDQRQRVTAAAAVAGEGPLVASVIQEFLGAAERGEARDRDGRAFAPDRLAQIRDGLGYVDGNMGKTPIQAVRRRTVQALIDGLHTAGLPSERIIEVIGTLRELFVYAIARDLVDFNPIVQLRLPAAGEAVQPPAPAPAYAGANGHGPAAAVADMPTAPYTPAFTGVAASGAGAWSPAAPDGSGPPDEFPGDDPAPGAPAADASPRAPWVPGATPPPPQPTPPAQPVAYDPPMFTTPVTPPTPIAATTQYGTPTFGTDPIAAQPTVMAPTQAAPAAPAPGDGVLVSEQMFWWITRIVVIVFVLIALVLVAESV